MADKTRAERIIELRAEAESILIDLTLHANDSVEAGSARNRLRLAFAEALALPPDPPRGDGWEALRELRATVLAAWDELIAAKKRHDPGSEMRVIAQAQANDLQGVIAAIDRLLAAAPEETETAESPAEPAQDDGYRSLDHACEILRGCVAPYSGEQAQAVAKALKQWRDKWLAAVDCIHPDERQAIADLRAKLAAAQGSLDALRNQIDDARDKADAAPDETLYDAIEGLRGDYEMAANGRQKARDEVTDLRAKLAELRASLRIADDIIVRGQPATGNEPESVCQFVEVVTALRAKLAAAEAALVARHGGEPIALLAELDEARAKLAAAEARIAMRDRAVLKLIHNSTGSVIGMGTMLLKDDAGYFEVRWARGVIEDVSPAELGKGGA